MSITRALLVFGLLSSALLAAAPAAAVGVTGGRGPAAPKDIVRAPAAVPPVVATLDLAEGTITAIDRTRRTFSVSGVTLAWHPTRLRIYTANGLRVGDADLHAGSRIRFALDPSPSESRTVVLIYLQAVP